MRIDVSSRLPIYPLLRGGPSAFSEASSPQKMTSFTIHVLLPDEAIEDVLPRNGDLVVKTLDTAEEEACSSCAPHRRRLVPRAECDRIVEKDAKDNLAEYNSLEAPCSMQGHRHLVEEVSRGTGHCLMYSPEEPTTRAAAAAGSGNRQHGHCSAVAWPDYRFEALRCRPRVHPARHAAASVDDDELPHGRVQQRRGGNAKQLPSEATHEVAPTQGCRLCGGAGAGRSTTSTGGARQFVLHRACAGHHLPGSTVSRLLLQHGSRFSGRHCCLPSCIVRSRGADGALAALTVAGGMQLFT
ncbi:uncharacterized protein [Dermacentor albipictus]|uniref:uncharacterized protein n=1 Tax=Dermacentor albipictus TaxID=60249 RepID=UPI0031FD6E86